MKPPSPLPDSDSRRQSGRLRWLIPAVLFGLAPKCLLCLAAWLPLGAWLGRKSVEICGAPGNTDWAPWPSIAGGVVGLAVSFAWRQRRFAG